MEPEIDPDRKILWLDVPTLQPQAIGPGGVWIAVEAPLQLEANEISWEPGKSPAIEQLDDLFRRYAARKDEPGAREVLSDDIKCTTIELLVPQDLEKH